MITSIVKSNCAHGYRPQAHDLGMDVSERLRAAMQDAGITNQTELAKAVGCTSQAINRLLKGESKEFSCPAVFHIARARGFFSSATVIDRTNRLTQCVIKLTVTSIASQPTQTKGTKC